MISSVALALPTLKLPPFLVPYLGADSSFRVWGYTLIACAFLFLFRGSRRLGGFGFLATIVLYLLYTGLSSMMASVTPK